MLVLQLVSGAHPLEPLEQLHTENEIENLVVAVNLRRIAQKNGPISQNGIDFILACLDLQPYARPTAAGAAKHSWLRESPEEILLFKEREKQLFWKPRDMIIPAVVRLPDVDQNPILKTRYERDAIGAKTFSLEEEGYDQQNLSKVIPEPLQNLQSFAAGSTDLHSLVSRRSTFVV